MIREFPSGAYRLSRMNHEACTGNALFREVTAAGVIAGKKEGTVNTFQDTV